MPKGAKDCPACGATVGCRSHECDCGHVFKSAIAGTAEHEANEEPGFFPVSGYTITTPAGKCPVAFQGDLESWVDHLQSHCQPNQYAASALRYWLRGLVNLDEYKALAPRLPALCGEASE